MTPNITKALIAAQHSVKSARKDGLVAADDRRYATVDELVEVGKEALKAAGLGLESGGLEVAEKHGILWQGRTWRLIHSESDEVRSYVTWWPLQKGQAIDKAWAALDSYALGYFMRDLLLIARRPAGEIEVDQRRDGRTNVQSHGTSAPDDPDVVALVKAEAGAPLGWIPVGNDDSWAGKKAAAKREAEALERTTPPLNLSDAPFAPAEFHYSCAHCGEKHYTKDCPKALPERPPVGATEPVTQVVARPSEEEALKNNVGNPGAEGRTGPPAEGVAVPSVPSNDAGAAPQTPDVEVPSIDECPTCGAHVGGIVDGEDIPEGNPYTCANGHELVSAVKDGRAWLVPSQEETAPARRLFQAESRCPNCGEASHLSGGCICGACEEGVLVALDDWPGPSLREGPKDIGPAWKGEGSMCLTCGGQHAAVDCPLADASPEEMAAAFKAAEAKGEPLVAPTPSQISVVSEMAEKLTHKRAEEVKGAEKKRRGRPPGSKNKKKAPSTEKGAA